MAKVYLKAYGIPSVEMGADNPLPDIKNNTYIHAQIDTTAAITEEERKRIGTGMIPTLLPYTIRDNYDRCRKDKDYQAVILENRYLKAVFLPELGGRLWSLIDKETNRELLYRNPVFQPGNLALRNAWFSGGVEFNVSIKGHNPLTCSPMFAQKITMEDGSEGIRMYEYERIRKISYHIDAWIPEESRMLYIRPCIENRNEEEVWMYWWSNIAVPQTLETRVIVPADAMYINYFGNDHYILDSVNTTPYAGDVDASYPMQVKHSRDFFYKIPEQERKWIAAVDKDGQGLLQCSTKELIGRKLFVWGDCPAGKNWNRFLSDGTDNGYIEIQAGLAYTQLEHIPMPAGETWSWVEAYGAIAVPAEKAHGQWVEAKKAVDEDLNSKFPQGVQATLQRELEVKAQPGELLLMGSGWGALEDMIRNADGQKPLSAVCLYPDKSIAPIQVEWITLLKENRFPEASPYDAPKGYLVDTKWKHRLRKAMEKEENRHWYSWMHLGVMEYAAGNTDEAKNCMEQSMACTPNAWAARNLAMLWKNEYQNIEKADSYIEMAVSMNQSCRGILLDAASIWLASGKAERWLAVYRDLSDSLKNNGKLKFNCALAYIQKEDYFEAAKYLNADLEMPDIKEGDTAISDVWHTLYGHIVAQELQTKDQELIEKTVREKYPLGHLDFKVH